MTEIKEYKEITKQEVIWRVGDAGTEVFDPRVGCFRNVAARSMRNIQAEVSERWVANVVVPVELCQHIIDATFLEPILVNGRAVLSLCAIFMRHAAPTWAPLSLGPGSHNCALRITCRDVRTQEPAVWVDHRYTDSTLTGLASQLGFPPIFPYLRVDRWSEGSSDEGMILDCSNGALRLDMQAGFEAKTALLFADADSFAEYFNAAVRSYGPGPNESLVIVDLHKKAPPQFGHMQHWHGVLDTSLGRWVCDGIYRSGNNVYNWEFLGHCDRDGEWLHA